MEEFRTERSSTETSIGILSAIFHMVSIWNLRLFPKPIRYRVSLDVYLKPVRSQYGERFGEPRVEPHLAPMAYSPELILLEELAAQWILVTSY